MSGKRIALDVKSRTIEVNGKSASVLGIQQPNGTHGLTTVEDMPFRVHLTDQLSEQTLIHWHGIIDPWRQDGVPHISAPPLHPGQSIDYQFPLRQSGTYWMHSHDGLQVQRLASAPLIIHDNISRKADVQEVVIILNDFTFHDPHEIFTQLNKTAMSHPMHLHGHRFQVVSIGGHHFAGAVRDTILVPAHKSVSIAFYADNFGRWAYHCHNLYHQMAGMFTVVAYRDVHVPKFPPMRI